MPYRRLPKTDTARLRVLKTLLENSNVYVARNRFIDWKSLNKAQPAYDRLLTAHEQYECCLKAQSRNSQKTDRLQHKATMYVSHFLQVLFMAIDRGEIKKKALLLYGLSEEDVTLPDLKTPEKLKEWTSKIVQGEKERIKQGGRPIYNPTISMVATHHDIFTEAYTTQQRLAKRTQTALAQTQCLRDEVDQIILDIWNQIEKHYENEPPERRFEECRKFGIIYYYRKNEKHLY